MQRKLYNDYRDLKQVDNNEEAIKNSIKNILTTRIGTLPGKPTFGSELYRIIFEPIDHITKDIINTYIIGALVKWEKRIQVTDIEVKEIPEYNKIVINISFSYVNFENIQSASVSIQFNKIL